jgi:CubicO group peptidase (beta-lactamase class C family)
VVAKAQIEEHTCSAGSTADPGSVGLSAENLQRISPTIQKFIDEEKIAGAVAIVARRGRAVHFEAYGMRHREVRAPMQTDTIFRIYSMTKPVAAVAAMMLYEEGSLSLNAPVSDYLPELGGLKVAVDPDAEELVLVDPIRDMSVFDLFRHTSGLPGSSRYLGEKFPIEVLYREAGLQRLSECNLQEVVERLGTVPLLYQPGTRWHYSIAADVLGRLIEVISGLAFDKFLAERIFQPLHMKDTGFYVPPEKIDRFARMYGPAPNGGLETIDAAEGGSGNISETSFVTQPKFLSGGGGLVSTAADFMRFCLMLTGDGYFDGVRLLKAETVEMMTRNQLPEGLLPINRKPEGRGFGLGFAVRVRKLDTNPSPVGEYEWYGGAGTEFWISPSDALAVVVLSQQLPMQQLGRALRPVIYAAIEERK